MIWVERWLEKKKFLKTKVLRANANSTNMECYSHSPADGTRRRHTDVLLFTKLARMDLDADVLVIGTGLSELIASA